MSEIPRIKLQQVDRLTSIFASLLPRGGAVLTLIDIQRLTDRVERDPIKALEGLSVAHLRTTLCQYVGKAMTGRVANLIARQLAARFNDVCIMPLPAFQEIAPGWAAFEVVDAKAMPWRETDYGHTYTLYTLTGRMAGMTFDKKFPDGWLRGLAYKLGYSRRNVYSDNGRDMIGFRFWARVAVSERDPKIPEIVDIVADAQVLKHNKAIVKKRVRLEKDLEDDPCPNAFEHPCSECTVTAAECGASYRRIIHGA